MRTCGIVKFCVAVILLMILPIVIGDHGFRDYQLKFGYGFKEFRALKWLNKIIGLDRNADPPAPQFPPIKVHGKPFVVPPPHAIAPIVENPPQVPFNPSPSNDPPEPIQIKQTAEAPPVPIQNNSSALQSLTRDSPSSSVDSTSPPAIGHSYKDYLYMKWFHGSPKATYFNETPVPSVVDSKLEKVNQVSAAGDSKVSDHFDTDEQQPALSYFWGDSILSRMFSIIKRTLMIPRIQKQDIGPLKFYDEPPKPQLFSVPPVAFPVPYDPLQSAPPTQTEQVLDSSQLPNSLLANDPPVPVYNPPNSLPNQEESPIIVQDLDTSLPVAATTFKPSILGYGLSEAPEETSASPLQLAYDLPIPFDNQPFEPFSNVPDNSQPLTTIIPIERTIVPLQTAYTNPAIKRTSIDAVVQSPEEPDYNAFLLAYKTPVPNYAA